MLHELLADAPTRSPSLGDFAESAASARIWLSAGAFITDEVLGCREGHKYRSIRDEPIPTLFNRRSGAITAAISITIESPDLSAHPS